MIARSMVGLFFVGSGAITHCRLAAIALVALLMSGCQSAARKATWTEQTPFREMPAVQARAFASNWAGAEPTRRGWSVVGTTGSMRPTLRGGEILLLRKPAAREVYRPGQLVIWVSGYSRVSIGYSTKPVHRVIAVRGNALLIQGDGNVRADGWFSRGTIDWVVEGIVREPRRQTR